MQLPIPTSLLLAATLTLAGCAGRPAKSPAAPGPSSATNSPPTSATVGTNYQGHPLGHPQFKMVTAPKGTWNVHWMYPNEVMSYLLKGPDEAALARRILDEYGLGRGEKSYLFVARDGAPLVVNGTVFQTRNEAAAFVKKKKIPRLLYVPENNAFPTQIPVWLDEAKISVWVLKWQR